ncbi:hypothetical protein [Shinella zoogloeoides]|uniref:hypothetical protein n=1 Tax=Shinella zoogloeoides TaxID=352475 RepID=UPI0028A7E125|nr:hypothetical protein [Shinella zoogloeoides]
MATGVSKRGSVLWPGVAAVLAAALPAAGQTADSGLVVEMTVRDRAGQALRMPRSREPFRLALKISDAKTGQQPTGLKPSAWIRPVAADNASCTDTARALRVTRGTPRGVIDLNGELIGVLNDDASFGVVDRRLDQNGANMIAAATFERRPDAIAFDRAGLRALAVLTAEGRIEAVDLLTGERQPLAGDLATPTDVLGTAAGNLWIAEAGRDTLVKLKPDGTIGVRLALPGGPGATKNRLFLRETGLPGLLGAYSGDGRLALVDDWASAIVWSASGPPITDARFIGNGTVVVLPAGAKAMDVRYTDDPGVPLRIPVGIDATRLAISEDGRHAIAYSPGKPLFVVVDLATSQLVEAGHMQERMAVQEAAFVGRNLYILSEDGGAVAIFEIAALGRKDRPSPRIVGLARGQPEAGGAGTRITPLDASRALVVDRGGAIGLVLHDAMAIGNVPPEDYVRLRSGVPLSIGVIDRSLAEIAPGRFETVARVEAGGEHELILTTGVGGLTTCIRFTVEGDDVHKDRIFTLKASPRDGTYSAGRPETVDFEFHDGDGREIAVPRARFLVSSLQSSWTMPVDAQRDGDNRLQAQIRFPHPGLFSISPVDIPQTFELREPALAQVSP